MQPEAIFFSSSTVDLESLSFPSDLDKKKIPLAPRVDKDGSIAKIKVIKYR